MSEKRTDKRGRVLRRGESQRKNGTYCYRYTDMRRERQIVYAKTLEELREKEERIKRDLLDGIDYAAGNMTVAELVAKYVAMRRGLKTNSLRAYDTSVRRIADSEFGKRRTRDVKVSDAKQWFVQLNDGGLKRNTIDIMKTILKPAFDMAIDDEIVRKNPFNFNLSDILPDDAEKRVALTREQQEEYLKFVRENGSGYYDEIEILLGTGLRVSELYGLTVDDIDFAGKCLHVRRQLCRTADKPRFLTSPKSASGIRTVPMNDRVCFAFRRALARRKTPAEEVVIDGCSGFIFLDSYGMPKVAMHLSNKMRELWKKLEKLGNKTIPKVTAHVLRHTFCTTYQQAGLDIKNLQYIMGHADASTTLDVYAHSDYASAEAAFRRVAGSI